MMRLPMYQAASKLVEAFVRRQPILGNKAEDDAASPGGCPQFLAPLARPREACMIDEDVGEAIDAQPSFQFVTPCRPRWNGLRTGPPCAAHLALCGGTKDNRLRIDRDAAINGELEELIIHGRPRSPRHLSALEWRLQTSAALLQAPIRCA